MQKTPVAMETDRSMRVPLESCLVSVLSSAESSPSSKSLELLSNHADHRLVTTIEVAEHLKDT